jgi:hypothetical protein
MTTQCVCFTLKEECVLPLEWVSLVNENDQLMMYFNFKDEHLEFEGSQAVNLTKDGIKEMLKTLNEKFKGYHKGNVTKEFSDFIKVIAFVKPSSNPDN